MPTHELPADPQWPVLCRNHLADAMPQDILIAKARAAAVEQTERPRARTPNGVRAQAILDALEGRITWARAREIVSARLLDDERSDSEAT